MPDQNHAQTNGSGESSLHAPGPSLRNIEKIPVARARLRKRLRPRPLRPPSRRSVLTVCAAFSALALLIWIYNALDLGRALNQDWLGAHLRVLGVWGYPLFVLLAAIVTSIAGPRQLVSFAGGYVYGPLLGAALSLLGALLGCLFNFLSARFLARDRLRRRLGPHCERVDAVVRRSPFLMTIAVRLMPVGNNTATSLAAGLSCIPLPPFLAGSAIGYLPMTVVFALLGSGLQMDKSLNIAIGAGLFAASIGLGLYLFKKLRARA